MKSNIHAANMPTNNTAVNNITLRFILVYIRLSASLNEGRRLNNSRVLFIPPNSGDIICHSVDLSGSFIRLVLDEITLKRLPRFSSVNISGDAFSGISGISIIMCLSLSLGEDLLESIDGSNVISTSTSYMPLSGEFISIVSCIYVQWYYLITNFYIDFMADIDVNHLKLVMAMADHAILEIYNDKSAWNVEYKSDDSPLTLADKVSNQIICEQLKRYGYPIISEENAEIPFEVRRKYHRYWLVDPIDGTKEFIKRNGEFTVNIALMENDVPIAGFVSVPCENVLYYAVKGSGAFKLVNYQNPIQIKANNFCIKDKGLRIFGSRSHMNDKTMSFINGLNMPQLIVMGSSLKFMKIAEGEVDIYPRFAPTMEWDTGASEIILKEAGGFILGPMLYNKECLKNPSFVAYGNVRLE